MTDAPGLAWSTYERWCALLGIEAEPCSPIARVVRLPAWMSPELVATVASRRKLAAWATSKPRNEWEASGDPASVLVSLHCTGDELLPHSLARLLCRLPPPMRAYLVEHVSFLLVGAAMLGWCGAVPDFGARRFVVCLSAHGDDVEAFADLCAHECAHAWLEPEPVPGARCASSFASATLRSTPLANIPADVRDRVLAERRRSSESERVARALTKRLGFFDL